MGGEQSRDIPSRSAIENALADADLPVLLMVLVHLSGDRRWMEAPFLPARTMAFFGEEGGGFSPAIQAEIRSGALELLDATFRARAAGDAPPPLRTQPSSER